MSDPVDIPAGAANLKPTAILDIGHEEVQKLAKIIAQPEGADRARLQKAHLFLVQELRPVYSVKELQPVSRTLRNKHGSCSQRMACLEALARAVGIPTRVRAFHVKGSFWYPRFRLSRYFIPRRILLVWPQFFLDGLWVDFDELYAPTAQLVATAKHGFTNDGESLFEAVQHTPVDFLGKTCGLACAKPEQNLSHFILSEDGFFDTRDEAFDRFGYFGHTFRGRMFESIWGDRQAKS
jgi:transglutaminase-like putative cysteine protease